MKVQVYCKNADDTGWDEADVRLLDFARLPAVGEYVELNPADGVWYGVQMVVHLAHEADCVAQLYCSMRDSHDVLTAANEDF